jgi:hypothetical protein
MGLLYFYCLINNLYIVKCLEQFHLITSVTLGGKSILRLYKDFKLFCFICLQGLEFTPLQAKKLYWWNYFYFESDFFLPHTYYVDEISVLSRRSAFKKYHYWWGGSVVQGNFRFVGFKYIEGAHFNRLLYSRCERPVDPRILKLKYAFNFWVYNFTIML